MKNSAPNTPDIIEEQVFQNRPNNNTRFIGFHGTGADTAQSIIENGYDPALVVNQTQQLGPGLYVTDNFGVAVDYAVGAQGREPGIFAVYLPNYDDVDLYLMEYDQNGDTVINKKSFDPADSEGQLLMREYDAFYAPLHHELSVYRSGLPIDEVTARTRIASQWKVNARAFRQGSNVAPILVPLDLSNIENVESLGWQYRGP